MPKILRKAGRSTQALVAAMALGGVFAAPNRLTVAEDAIPFQTGLDVLQAADFAALRGKRVGVVTNPTGVDRRLRSLADLIHQAEGVQLAALFGPEHGVRGVQQAGEKVRDGVDAATGVPVYSLYGKVRRPTQKMLDGVDALVFDIQDIGVRTYTYLSTLKEVLHAAAESDKEVWILDRPVPIGALRIEGPVLEDHWRSFVGAHPIPLRHGLSAGEFAELVNREAKIGADLHVVRMRGYRRSMPFSETRLPWIAPSPNIPTVETARLYAGMVLVEGTNLSEGRGTTRPFHLVGAPWLTPEVVIAKLELLRLSGCLLRATAFQPTFSKYTGESCRAIEVHVTDGSAFRPVATAVAVIGTIRTVHAKEFRFKEAFFDRLAGTSSLRRQLESGRPHAEIVASWEVGLERFEARRQGVLLYE